MVNPHIKQQLTRSSNAIPLRNWQRAVLGETFDNLDVWESKIASQAWVDDPVIRQQMTSYCVATSETHVYPPLIALNNRILELGREKLSASYPVSDITFAINAHTDVVKDKAQGKAAARRRPDVIMTRSAFQKEVAVAATVKASGRPGSKDSDALEWGEIVQCVEVKKNAQRQLLAEYNAQRAKLGLPPVLKVCHPLCCHGPLIDVTTCRVHRILLRDGIEI